MEKQVFISYAGENRDGFSAPADLDETLKLLKRHDVIAEAKTKLETDSSYRIASRLMRQWINRQGD